jgi:hypothetical protein
MPRTKQTARRSTRGPAEQVALATLQNAVKMASTSIPTIRIPQVCNGTTVNPRAVISVSANRQRGPIRADNTSQQWCSLCYDGGNLVVCKICSRAVCDQCILFPNESLKGTAIFTCPDCWLKGDHKMDPYTVCVSFLHHWKSFLFPRMMYAGPLNYR